MRYPVTVVIPTLRSRASFLYQQCIPSVLENNPSEVVIIPDRNRNANENRNAGAAKATQPFLLFVDDDATLERGCIAHMLAALEQDSGASYAYSQFRIEVVEGIQWPAHCKGDIFPGNFSFERLRSGNYINTTSLIRTEHFPGFDERVRKYQDWDLWLTMASAGRRGVYVPKRLVTLYQIDQSISTSVPDPESKEFVKKKHGLK